MANLPITVETNQLAGLEKAFDGVTKAVGGLSKITPSLAKVIDDAAAKMNKLSQANEQQTVTVDKATRILERQKGILAEMSRDYTRGEASVLEYAKAAGATKTQLKELETTLKSIRSVMGTDPFDNSIGAIRRYQTENKVLAESFKSLKSGAGLANSEIRDLIRVKQQATEAAKREGAAEQMTQSSIRNLIKLRVKEATDAYKEEIALNRQLTKQIKEYENNLKRTVTTKQAFNNVARSIVAQGLDKAFKALGDQTKRAEADFERMTNAGKRVEDTLARMTRQAQAMSQGLTKDASAGLFAFEQAARAAGKTEKEIQLLSFRYMGLQQQMTDISNRNRKLGSSFLGLQSIIRAAFPAAGAIGFGVALVSTVTAVVQTSDALTLLSNRLSVATGGAADFNTEFENILRIANESRTSVQDVGTLYARLIPVVEKLGGTTAEAAAVTESFSKLLLLGGSNTREASAAIVQFSQALGKGKLDGDEFRSIAEATPEVLRLLEDSLGKTRGELMKMSKDGQLTADILGNVLINALDGLDARLMGIPLTVGQAFQVLKNNLTDSTRLFEESTNTVGSLSSAIQSLATFVYDVNRAFKDGEYVSIINTISDLTAWIGTLAVSMAVVRTATMGAEVAYKAYTKSAGAASIATAVFNKVLGLNPIVRTVTLVLGLASAMLLLKDRNFELNGSIVDLGSLFSAVFGGMVTSVQNFLGEYGSITAVLGNVFDKFVEFGEFMMDINKTVLNTFIGTFVAVGKTVGNVAYGMYDAFKNTFSDIGKLISAFITDLKAGDFNFTNLGQAFNESFTRRLDIGKQAIKDISDAYSTDYVGSLQKGIKAQYEAVVASAAQIKVQKDYENILDDLVEQNERLASEEEDRAKRKKDLLKLIAQGSEEESKAAQKFAKMQKAVIESVLDSLGKLEDQYSNYGGSIDSVEKAERAIIDAFETGITTAQQYTDQIIRLAKVREARDTIEYAEAQAKAAVEMNKVLEASDEQTKSYKDQVIEIEEQILKVGKQKDALLDLELAKIDDIIATKQQKIEMNSFGDANDALIASYREQIKELEKLKNAKSRLTQAEKDAEFNKELEKIFDDVGKIFGEAIFNGGSESVEKLGDNIKKYFKSLIVKLVIEPELKSIGSQISNLLSGKSVDFSSLGSSIQNLSAGLVGGQMGSILNSLGNNADSILGNLAGVSEGFAQSAYAFTATGQKLLAVSNTLGKVAPYAGAIALALQGNVKGAAGAAAGTYLGGAAGAAIGGTFGGPVGAAIGKAIGAALGSFLGSKLGGGGKISAVGLDPSFGIGVSNTLSEQYKSTVEALGGTALSNVVFGAGGNTGRQSQNPNFTIGASVGGRGVFNSANTREGQADGLFLSGEIALNEANLADQSLRALFSVLKETDFADNIDEVIDRVNTFSDSFEVLNAALSDAQLLKTINEEFPKLGGALATLAGQSIDTVKTFILLAGGFENLQSMQNAYISAIYTQEEQLALATGNLETAFEALGISVPSTTADFKALVEAQNLTSVEGQATYLALLQLSGAFKEIKDAQQQALEEQIAEQERLLEEQQRAAEEAAEALRELAEAYDDLTKKTQDYISEITNGALTSLERNALTISELMSEIGSEQDAMEKIALQNELSDLIFERYQLEKEQIQQLQSLIQDVFSSIQTEADNVNQARDAILGVQTTTGSRSSIASRIAQATGSASFNPVAAQANLTAEIERFRDSSLNAVGVLGKLREETVRYYEQQKALSDLMKNTASSIRASINQVQFADLTPQQQLQNLEAQFSSLFATALTSSGSTLANTGAELQSLIGPLLEKASEIYASGPEFQRIKELVLGQAGTVADKLEELAPANYQEESLGLLDQIDQSLIAMMNQANLANQTLIDSLETASDRAVAALNSLLFGLLGSQLPDVTTQPVTQPALNAPVATLASAEFSGNSATTGGSFGAIVDELKALREDVKNSGDIQIKVVTTDGRVLVDETLTQIKTRSKRGELVIFADGVK